MEKIIKILVSLILTIIFIELSARSFLFITTHKSSIFKYGFDSNIKINSHSFKKLEFYISDQSLLNSQTTINQNKKNNILIWVFGGSSSKGGVCNKASLSWPLFLEKKENYKIQNFAKHNVFSDFSVNLLISELQKKDVPDIIFWAHKWNEKNVITFGLDRNKNKIKHKFKNKNLNSVKYFLKSLSLSFKENFVFYYLMDESIIRIGIKLGKDLRKIKVKDFSNISYKIAAKNFEINTEDAIKISKKFGVKEFYITSLFNQKDILSSKENSDTFSKYYHQTVESLQKKYEIFYIDTVKDAKKFGNKKLFCDAVHQNKFGNELTSEIIYKFLKNNSDL